jgi:hypothetical protein
MLTGEERQRSEKTRKDDELTCSCLLVLFGLTACALNGDRRRGGEGAATTLRKGEIRGEKRGKRTAETGRQRETLLALWPTALFSFFHHPYIAHLLRLFHFPFSS